MVLKAGQQLRSTVCTTEVVVVRAPSVDVDLQCGGAPMVDKSSQPAPETVNVPEGSEGTLIGKRYADEELNMELLCTKAGAGDLSVDGRRLELKSAKPLPASD